MKTEGFLLKFMFKKALI